MTHHKWIGILACGVGLLAASPGLAQNLLLDAASISNAGSYIPTNYPNGGVARGSAFIVKAAAGSDPLGACGVKVADQFPIATSMNGTSMKITMAGSPYDIPMIYVVACTGIDQLAGIVPSNVPVGAGTLTVTFNGQSATAPVTVADRAPGFFTINQGGTGAAIIQNFNSATDLVINTLATPARPGQTEIAWATGLGPDGNSDVEAPKPTDIPIDLELYVGGKRATVAYKGRSGCCAGIDQIAFVVPDGVDGCFVPVVAKIGNSVSNFTTMSVSASGGTCSDSAGLSASDIETARGKNKIRLGIVDLFRADIEVSASPNSGAVTRTDQASAVFAELSYAALLGLPVREISTPGSCTVWRGNSLDLVLDRPPVLSPAINLDAGTITISGDAGASVMNYRPNLYAATLGTAGYQEPAGGPAPSTGFLEPGTFRVSGAGGGPVPGGTIGVFNGQISIAAPPKFDNRFSVGDIQRNQGVTVNWSGVDAAATVEIRGISTLNAPGLSGSAFFCTEKASAGQFTIPPYVLLSLPASDAGGSALGLSVAVSGTARFNAAGVDVGLLRYHSLFGRGATFH